MVQDNTNKQQPLNPADSKALYPYGATVPPLVMSVSFETEPGDVHFSGNELGAESSFFYTRWGNPTVGQLEQKLAALEGGAGAVCFASGMAAIAGLWLQFLSAGDHIIVGDIGYAATAELARDMLPRLGIGVSFVDFTDVDELREQLRKNTKMIYFETPCNPTVKVIDIAAVAAIAREAGIKVAVDSTFATPIATRPLQLGANFVIHSLTKYAAGHGDALGGALVSDRESVLALRRGVLIHLGAALSPFNAWLTLRGLETLYPRMMVHASSALVLAELLERIPGIKRVFYPGLPSHPQHELATRQMTCFSGVLSFTADDPQGICTRIGKSRFFHYAVSVGKTHSLLMYLPTEEMLRHSYRLTSLQEQRYREIAGQGIFRLSTGLEPIGELQEDLLKVVQG